MCYNNVFRSNCDLYRLRQVRLPQFCFHSQILSTGPNPSASRRELETDTRKQEEGYFAQFWCNVSPFRINTYRNARKC